MEVLEQAPRYRKNGFTKCDVVLLVTFALYTVCMTGTEKMQRHISVGWVLSLSRSMDVSKQLKFCFVNDFELHVQIRGR